MTGPTDPHEATPGQEVQPDRDRIRFEATVEDLLLRGVCTRIEAEAEATRLLRRHGYKDPCRGRG